MKNTVLAISLIVISTSALAKDMNVKLYGKIDTQFGVRQQNGSFNNLGGVSNAGKMDNYGVVNDSKLGVEASNKLNNGIEYGAVIEISADTSKDSAKDGDAIGKKTMFYMQNEKMGRFEAGSGSAGASGIMQISANKIARGSGGIKGAATKWINKKYPTNALPTADFDKEFIKWATLPADCSYDDNASKITYYTPTFGGLQIGVSYTPNLDHTGTVYDINNPTIPTDKTTSVTAVEKFKEVIQAGISYSTKINDFKIKTSFTGEHAKSSATAPARHGLLAWEVGATVEYKGLSIAGSYSDWNKTGAPKNKIAGKKYGGGYWTAGAAYSQNKFGVSATYFNSKKANLFTSNEDLAGYTARNSQANSFNKFEMLSIGADYTVAQGFMPYAEVSLFKAKLSDAVVNNKGTIYLLGTKLAF